MSDRIREAIERKLILARAATPGRWEAKRESEYQPWRLHEVERFREYRNHVFLGDDEATARHMAANDPASVIRACEAALRVLERHPGEVCSDHPNGASHMICIHCDGDWPCDDFRDLADMFGVNLEETA